MPIYEYQGQKYEMSTTDPTEAKQKIMSHLEGKKPAQTSAAKAFGKSAVESTAPSVGGFAGAVAGAELAAPLGAPLGPLGVS